MNTRATLQLHAAYNQWVNARLLACCTRLSNADYRRNLGAFFGSVHGTLNHLLVTDHLWLARIQGTPIPPDALNAQPHPDLATVQAERARIDTTIIEQLERTEEADLQQELRYTSRLTNSTMALPLWVAWTHLFNHQTHHRGQLTVLLSQLGIDYADIDLVWMPGVAEVKAPA
ncbi:MAG: DinB family protein [Pseudomonadota bacterium]|nr:DinB family protein [Pseudomonadota bacterium]